MVTTQKKDSILYVGFNQDQGCFAVGTQKGFKIYNTKPFKDQFVRGKLIEVNNCARVRRRHWNR